MHGGGGAARKRASQAPQPNAPEPPRMAVLLSTDPAAMEDWRAALLAKEPGLDIRLFPDAGDPAAIEARLAPLAEGPWGPSVQEIRALAAMKRGAAEEAKQMLTGLTTNPATPQGVRDRASKVLAEIGG